MKPLIKIVKRKQDEKPKQDEHSEALKTPAGEKSVEQSTRDVASTIKGWIAELQQRKRTQATLSHVAQ